MTTRTRAGLPLLVAALAACAEPTGVAPAPPPAFEAPVDLGPPVSSPGWEDSGFISPDGRYFYFTYLRVDPIALIQSGTIKVIGPLRPGWNPADTVAAYL